MYEKIKTEAIRQIKQDGFINLSCAGLCEAVGIKEGSFRLFTGYTFNAFVEHLKAGGVTDSGYHEARKSRSAPELRKQHILDTAVHIATSQGYRGLKQTDVARRAGISPALVSQYFTMNDLRREVVRRAIAEWIPEIVAEAVVNRHIEADGLTEDQKRDALNSYI